MENESPRRSSRAAAKAHQQVSVEAAKTAAVPIEGSRRSSRTIKPPPTEMRSLALPSPQTSSKARAKKKAKNTPKSNQKKKKNARQNPRRKSLPQCLQDSQGEQVWLGSLLATDIQRAAKTGKHPWNVKRQYLHTVASPNHRYAVYERTARAWQDLEQSLLPTYGGRSWKVTVTIRDPTSSTTANQNNKKGHAVSPFFCFVEGRLEVAVWPHWLLSIPTPPRFPGYSRGSSPTKKKRATKEVRGEQSDNYDNHDDDEEDDSEIEEEEDDEEEDHELAELQERQVSPLSELAMSERWRVPNPAYSIKWMSPLRETFTSRKSAWEHAKTLCQQEVFLDKILMGYHANGAAITKITTPSVRTVLKAGKLRFLRDGLWVIGQEEDWQKDRLEELEPTVEAAFPTTTTTNSRRRTALSFFIEENRKQHKDKRVKELAAKSSGSGKQPSFTFRQAEIELRTAWKELTDQERQEWAARVPDSDASPLTNQPAWNGEQYEGTTLLCAQSNGSELGIKLLEYNDNPSRTKADKAPMKHNGDDVAAPSFDKCSPSRDLSRAAQLESASEAEAPDSKDSDFLKRVSDPLTDEVKTVEKSTSTPEKGALSFQSRGVTITPNAKTNWCSKGQHLPTVGTPSSLISGVENAGGDVLHPSESLDPTEVGRVTPSSEGDASQNLTPKRDIHDDTVQRVKRKIFGGKKEAEIGHSVGGYSRGLVSSMPQPELASKRKAPVVAIKKTELKPGPSSSWGLNAEQIKLCYDSGLEHYDKVISTVMARDLTRELQDGFDVLRERGKGRFDMELPAFNRPEFDFLTDLKKTPWLPVVREILGKDIVLIHKGMFLSFPGAETQAYHQDGPHLTTQYQKPCHAINVFIPLIDLKLENGPTEFCLGSHILGQEDYDEDFLETPLVKAGTPVIFDYRLGHRGLANTSDCCRPIVYCTYAAAADGKEFRDSVNFSRKRYHKIGSMVEKGPSREERAQKRRRMVKLEEQIMEKATV